MRQDSDAGGVVVFLEEKKFLIFAYFNVNSLWIAAVNLQSALGFPSTPLLGHVSASSFPWNYSFETILGEISHDYKNVQIMVGMLDCFVLFYQVIAFSEQVFLLSLFLFLFLDKELFLIAEATE